ncbi:MAG: PAS domain-containing protein [Synechococcaceae cyanobacterium]|nr:PAS domain-containing protein [Synechococcaceae cyanobacterium]
MHELLVPSLRQESPGSEEGLAESLLELVFTSLLVPLALADGQGRLLRVNPALCRRLARREAELLGQPWAAVLGGLELPGYRTPQRLPIRLPRPDGSHEPLTLTLTPLCGADGALQRLLLQCDAPPQHDSAPAFSDRWQIATDSADIGVYDIHIPSGRVLYSGTYLRNLGYAGGSWTPSLEEWRNRLHPDDAPQVLAAMVTQRGAERMEMEYRLRHRDGSWRWMLDRGRVVEWDASGEPVRAVGTLLDVTERRRAQLELERANERMRLAARADGIGFWEYDMVADRPLWDDEMLRIYGISREEFTATGEAWEAFLHPDDQEQALGLRHSWEESDGVLEQRFRIIRPDGEVRHIRSSALLTRDAQGRPLRMTGINFDFTDKRRAEEAAMAAHKREQRMVAHQRRVLQQKLKTSLTAAAIAHEINQPLSIMLLHCQMAMERLEQGTGSTSWQDMMRPILSTLVEEAERMHSTIETMRMLLRNVQTELSPVDLSNVAGSALLYLLPNLRNVEVQRIGLTRPCLIDGDEVQLKICVSNILRNALQATEAQFPGMRRILVELQRQDDWVDLVVGDSGPGFGDRFPDTTVLRSSKKEGTGLGLYVVRTTLDNHGGTIHFGQSPLGGAEVRLRFPLLS